MNLDISKMGDNSYKVNVTGALPGQVGGLRSLSRKISVTVDELKDALPNNQWSRIARLPQSARIKVELK